MAGYLTALKLGGNQAFLCRDGSGCDIVQASRYSLLAGVPTAMWGAGLYVAIAVLAAMPRTRRAAGRPRSCWPRAPSPSRFTSRTLDLRHRRDLPVLPRLGRSSRWRCSGHDDPATAAGRRAAGRGLQARQAGGARHHGGVFTVFIGAFIFAADFSTPTGYQSALAQHLAKSNAIFYGAFW